MMTRRGKRLFLTAWLVMPFVLVGALWFAFPKRGERNLQTRAKIKAMAEPVVEKPAAK